jgi:hypothetical protein
MNILSLSKRDYPGIHVNDQLCTISTVLKDGDFLVLTFPIRGEATVRRDGKWRIHANDSDDLFPSDFHAHHLETGEKLDLYTGYLYDPTTNKLLYALERKKWIYILGELKKNRQPGISLRAEAILKNIKSN